MRNNIKFKTLKDNYMNDQLDDEFEQKMRIQLAIYNELKSRMGNKIMSETEKPPIVPKLNSRKRKKDYSFQNSRPGTGTVTAGSAVAVKKNLFKKKSNSKSGI